MTGRYTRKTVPLEVRGVSRDRIESHPLPEKADGSLPHPYYDFNSVLQPTFSAGTPTSSSYTSNSDRSSPHSDEPSWDVGHIATGNTTERSSECSIIEDEFDRAASKQVRKLFEEIDSMLFEDKGGTNGTKKLQTECKEWASRFPHLRILGRQLIPPQDHGYEVFSSGDTPRPVSGGGGMTGMQVTDVTEHDISLSHSMHEMSIMGRHVDASHAPSQHLLSQRRPANTSSSGTEEVINPLEEEIFAEDGLIEDIIAVDYKTSEDDLRSSSSNKWGGGVWGRGGRRRDMPPVTPQACVKDNISGATFDFIWQETISWLRNVLANYQDRIVPDLDESYAAVGGGQSSNQGSKMPFTLPGVGHSTGHGQVSPRGMDPSSRETSGLLLTSRPAGMMRPGAPSSLNAKAPALTGLLTISTKALFTREKSNVVEESGGYPGVAMLAGGGMRPGSQFSRPLSVRHERQSSASRRPGMNRTRLLAPLPQDRVKTPNTEDGVQLTNQVVRGFGLSVMHEQQPHHSTSSPPPPMYPRNGALPPILPDSSDSPMPGTSSAVAKVGALQKKTHFNMHRASSAVHEKEPRIAYKDREKTVLPIETRPSTTHAFHRSETPGFGGLGPNRRSSTPLGISTTLRGPLGGTGAPVGGGLGPMNPMQMSITGNSINPGHDPVHEMDGDPDHFDVQTTHWGSPNHLNPQMRRAKQQSNMPVR